MSHPTVDGAYDAGAAARDAGRPCQPHILGDRLAVHTQRSGNAAYPEIGICNTKPDRCDAIVRAIRDLNDDVVIVSAHQGLYLPLIAAARPVRHLARAGRRPPQVSPRVASKFLEPAHGQAAGGPGAPHRGGDDVPRDGDDVLAPGHGFGDGAVLQDRNREMGR